MFKRIAATALLCAVGLNAQAQQAYKKVSCESEQVSINNTVHQTFGGNASVVSCRYEYSTVGVGHTFNLVVKVNDIQQLLTIVTRY